MKYESRVLPGWEKYQSRRLQQLQMEASLGLSDPREFNPSNQEVSLKDRMASKMTPDEQYEMNNEPISPPQPVVLMAHGPRRRK